MIEGLSKSERIWRTVLAIPKGKVAAYGQIADLAGLPGRARLVSKAMSNAPNDLHLPWHRVLRSNGEIAFKAGSAQAEKQKDLLVKDKVAVIKNRVNLTTHGWQPDLGEMLAKLDF